MAINSSRIRDIARTLGISKDTATSVLRKLKNTVKPINEEYLKKIQKINQPITIEIGNALSLSGYPDALSVEMDEIWSYVYKKKNQSYCGGQLIMI